MRRDLLIGIGNPLRGDDGVGPALLEELAEERRELRIVHQLTPELALAVAAAGRVLFVDAWLQADATDPWIEPLHPPLAAASPALGPPGGHGLDPLAVVVMASALFGWQGEAALLRVPAFAFPHGPGFSAPLRRALPRARQLLYQWVDGA